MITTHTPAKVNLSKKVQTILSIAWGERHCYKECMPYHYGPGSRGYADFKSYMKNVAWFASIKDFSKIRGLEAAWEARQIEIYGADWRTEYPKYKQTYIDYYELCQKAAEEFLNEK